MVDEVKKSRHGMGIAVGGLKVFQHIIVVGEPRRRGRTELNFGGVVCCNANWELYKQLETLVLSLVVGKPPEMLRCIRLA